MRKYECFVALFVFFGGFPKRQVLHRSVKKSWQIQVKILETPNSQLDLFSCYLSKRTRNFLKGSVVFDILFGRRRCLIETDAMLRCDANCCDP